MTIAPLTSTLHGFSAVHYARLTGVTLHRAEVRRSLDLVEPARTVLPDEAQGLLQRDQSEYLVITCTATHGELPYGGVGPVEIDWPAIHAAAIVVDAERRGPLVYSRASGAAERSIIFGYDQLFDAFGGSYFPATYETEGIAGVVRILDAALRIRTAAWEAIHRAHRVTVGRWLAACALRTALALDHLFRALDAIGVYRYEPGSQICGVTGYEPNDTVQVTGLRWLAGDRLETEERTTMAEVAEFIAVGARSPR